MDSLILEKLTMVSFSSLLRVKEKEQGKKKKKRSDDFLLDLSSISKFGSERKRKLT